MIRSLLMSAMLIKLTFGSGSGIYLEEECDRIRRPIHELSKSELMLYVTGLQEIRKNGKYQLILDDHATHVNVHRGSSFFFWHTYLVWEVETQIRALGGKFKCFALPYYDWTVDAGRESSPFVLNTVFGGEGNAENDYCLNEDLWSIEHWPLKDSAVCADTEDVTVGCCLKRSLRSEITLPTAEEVGEVVQRHKYPDFDGGIVLQHQQVHYLFSDTAECAMATGYSPDDPLFMMLHAFTAYLRGLFVNCNGYGAIPSDELDDYPNAYTAKCADGYDECGTIELDDTYGFDFLSTREWSITSTMDITPRMLWDFTDWGVVYDIGTFYVQSSLNTNDACPQSQLFEDNRWFLKNEMSQTQTDSNSPPNILFILMDDLGWSDVSYNGGHFPTPNIDNLFLESINLKTHYSHLMCSPSRSQFITGRYAHHMGFGKMLPWDYTEIGGIPIGQPTIADWLQSMGGYKTYAVGKWHMGYAIDAFTPTYRGFDHFYGFYQGAIGYDTLQYKDIEFGDTYHYDFFEDGRDCFVDPTTTPFNTMDLFRDKAFEYIDANVNGDDNPDPFYLYLALQTMHVPLIMIDKYEQQCTEIIRQSGELHTENNRQMMKYCENLLYTDDIIGDVVNKLKANNDLWANTLVIFSTDNGGDIGKGGCNYPLRGTKGTLFDGNARTIALISGGIIPQDLQGTNRHSLFSALDWTPTLLSFAGLLDAIDESDRTWDGINQYEMIMYGDEFNTRDHIILNVGLQSLRSSSAVFLYPRDNHLYKYIAEDSSIDIWQYNNIDGWCDFDQSTLYAENIPVAQSVDSKYLFDLTNDISEKNNLLFSADSEYAEIVSYAISLFRDTTDNVLYHEPMTFLWHRLSIGDPDQNGASDGDSTFIRPFLSEVQYFNRIKIAFEMLNVESTELKALYLNKWSPPNTEMNAIKEYNVQNDDDNVQSFYPSNWTLLFAVVLLSIGCLWVFKIINVRKGTVYDQYSLLLNDNHNSIGYGTNE